LAGPFENVEPLADLGAVAADQVGPLEGPVGGVVVVVDVLRRVPREAQQLIDEPLTFRGVCRVDEHLRLLRSRQRPGSVEERSAEEGGVVAQARRLDADLAELDGRELVDHVDVGPPGEVHRSALRDDDGGDGRLSFEADERRPLTLADRPHPAVGIDPQDGVVERVVLGPVGDVDGAAVGVGGVYLQLLRKPGRAAAATRRNLQRRDRRGRRVGPRGAAFEPLDQELVIDGAGLEALAALVGDGPGRLQEEQAAGRIFEVRPPAESVADDGGVIVVRAEREDRQLEPALAVLAGVTRPGVAPGLRQHRHDVLNKPDRRLIRNARHGDQDRLRDPASRDGDDGDAVAGGQELSGGADGDDLRVRGLEGGGAGQVVGPLAGAGGDEQLGAGEIAGEGDGRGLNTNVGGPDRDGAARDEEASAERVQIGRLRKAGGEPGRESGARTGQRPGWRVSKGYEMVAGEVN
jgi:hypothetical protein